MPSDSPGARSARMRPLWARVDSNRTKLAAFVALFVGGSALLLAFALIAVPGAILGWYFTGGTGASGASYWSGYAVVVTAGFAVMLVTGAIISAVQLANAREWVRGRFKGRPLNFGEHPELASVVADMALAAGMSVPPEVLVLPDTGENAFAIGTVRERATIGVTQGMLDAFSADELRAVAATLVARIVAGDIMFGTALAALMGPIKAIRESPGLFFAGGDDAGDGVLQGGRRQRGSYGPGDGCGDGCGCLFRGMDDSREGGVFVLVVIAAVVATYVALVSAAWIVTLWGRALNRTSYEKADAEGMLLLKDPAPMLSALGKAIRSSTEVSDGDQSYDGIFYSPTSGTSRVDRAERRRFERLAEVLGVEGLAADLDAPE